MGVAAKWSETIKRSSLHKRSVAPSLYFLYRRGKAVVSALL